MGHGPVKGSKLPSGFPTGFPHPSGIPGGPQPLPSGAPFPAPGNGTNGGATGTGSGSPISTAVGPPESNSPETGAPGPVTIQSTLLIIPQPVSTGANGESPASTGVPGGPGGSSPSISGAPGSGPSTSPSASEAPGSGSGNGQSGATCGPATVTITQANTITVTVPAVPASGAPESGAPGGGAPQSEAPIQSQPASPSVASAPFPISNSSIPAGPTGTPTGIASASASALPIYSAPIVPPISPVVPASSTSAAPVDYTSAAPAVAPVMSSAAAPAAKNTVEQGTDAQPFVPAPTSVPAVAQAATQAPEASSAPVQALSPKKPQQQEAPAPIVAETATQAPEGSSVPVQALSPKKPQQQEAPAPVVTSSTPAAPLAQAPTTAAPAPVVAHVPDTKSVAPVVSSAPVSSAAPQTSSTPKSSGGVKARGLLYGSLPAAQTFDKSNIGWCWNWDSSVSPGVGQTQGSISGCEYVPQLLSDADVHTAIWSGNSAGYPYAMGFNEPDNCGGGGACMPINQAVSSWGTYMSHMNASLVSPATTNDLATKNVGLDYMTQFLDACKGCKFQALAFHWYGNAWDINESQGGLQPTIKAYQKLQQLHKIPELWIPEMAPNQAPTKDQMSKMLAHLDDASSGVTRYAFNGLDTNTGQQLTGDIASTYCA